MKGITSFKWLQERDKQILKTLYYHRYMNTSQIERLFFRINIKTGEIIRNPKIIANNRLRILRKHGCIKSYYSSDNADCIHTVEENGIFIVAAMMNKAFNDLYFSPRKDYLSFGMAEHCLMLTEVYIRLLEATALKGGKIKEFKVEQLNLIEFEVNNKTYGLKPDIFLWYLPDKNKNLSKLFYIEVDNDTETPNIFSSSKIQEGYEPLFDSKIIQKQYAGLFPHVITLCNSQGRIDRLKKVTNTKLNWTYLLYDEAEKLLDL